MDLDIMFGNILDSIDSTVGKMDFHAELQKCALRCAKSLVPIHNEWSDMLLSILHNWDADIKMSLNEAVDYMMDVCGYECFGEEIIGHDNMTSGSYNQNNTRLLTWMSQRANDSTT